MVYPLFTLSMCAVSQDDVLLLQIEQCGGACRVSSSQRGGWSCVLVNAGNAGDIFVASEPVYRSQPLDAHLLKHSHACALRTTRDAGPACGGRGTPGTCERQALRDLGFRDS